ncbi:MAG: Fic family protein [Candidatus Woesebacteria bacterium]
MLQFPYPVSNTLVASNLERIRFLSKVLESIPVSATVAQRIFHRQILKSSLFSARIEGNQLTFSDYEKGSGQDIQKREIENCNRAIQELETFSTTLTIEHLKRIHAIVMNGIHADAGKIRQEQSGVFDSGGNVVYLTPDRNTLKAMLDVWLTETNKERDFIEHIVDSARLHYYFEKMHPFLDGNGRTGRILLQWQLKQSKLFGKFILPVDEYFDEHKSAYYAYLERSTRHAEEFTLFVLEGYVWALEHILTDIKTVGEESVSVGSKPLSSLLPRRSEIVAIITDHPLCSFDFIARRFPKIPVRTLAYDIQALGKLGLVMKHGNTRGVRYSANGSQK